MYALIGGELPVQSLWKRIGVVNRANLTTLTSSLQDLLTQERIRVSF